MGLQSIPVNWGATSFERALPFPCDRYLLEAEATYFRAIDIRAPAHTLFQWLCQLRVAPYSYDMIDNWGHRSPRYLISELQNLEVGQRVMTIFRLVEFEADRHLTLVLTSPPAITLFGEIAISYLILPLDEQYCRLVAKLLLRFPQKRFGRLQRAFLPWGDLFMMRKQFLNIKHLAESHA
ncbi:hypothetical protein EPA93_46410 [Ktedonosporobacter rubrisoli]|uniref:DUF2867 domain-containing protein n=1 Tax=Ktedonosporobacter rubrisoli TaxID=2509675 RepID=A0A4P6K612_KTERU|nr:hypothetical protein [Ktedonosporobacter rubrisoli]QBD83006.1 hypothetical protein EPA93_46410 [Ktedonosporobacter rubrisoli]